MRIAILRRLFRACEAVLAVLAPVCFLLVASHAAGQASAPGAWTWMGGSSTIANGYASPGVYGTLGTPSPANIPYSRVAAASWTDNAGHLWMFGGFTWDSKDRDTFLNDLWEFDPSTNEWTWQGGSDNPPCGVLDSNPTCGQPGVYGTMGSAAAANVPGGRQNPANWTDKNGNLWLYGGLGFDGAGQWGALDDLWKFDPATKLWTWMGGHTSVPGTGNGYAGVYGTQGTPAPGNNPGGLNFADFWTDPAGNGWIFGGWGNDVNGINGLPNNLWKFDAGVEQWAWIEGSPTFSTLWIHPSVFGTMGTPAPDNTPGSRWIGASWADSAGHLWLFGGGGYDADANSGFLNEFWEYDPAAQEWTWVAGQQVMNCAPDANKQNCGNPGVYGTLGQPAAANLPGGRSDMAFWTGKDGKFWLFSGDGFNDKGQYGLPAELWEFDPATREWAWVGGDPGKVLGSYGTLKVTSTANLPNGRHAAATWTDADGNLWLFGGNGPDANGNAGIENDMWRYQLAFTPPPPPDFAVALNPGALTIKAGQSGKALLTITPDNGFQQGVTFACLGLPANAACTFSPQQVTPGGSAASTTLTVETEATSARTNRMPFIPGTTLAAALACLMLRKSRWRTALLATVCLAGFLGTFTACANINTGNSQAQPVTSHVTVTATSGTLRHTVSLTITVD